MSRQLWAVAYTIFYSRLCACQDEVLPGARRKIEKDQIPAKLN